MTPDRQLISRIKEILSQALAHQAGAERNAFLDRACENNVELRREVEDLLTAYETADDLLSRDASGEALLDLPDLIGTMIDNYRLVEHIGEGGFGEVYRAEQIKPLHREVALKVIKLGMDTKNIIARFEVERQVLAHMNHPGIAQVYDAGATESGRPYFVMELFEGEPILKYCDRNRLSLPDRINLFQQVCDAVQHAHKKGILHRDLKPSNILVGDENGKPHSKIIDFGIAKSLDGRLTEETLATLKEMLMGTPMYMSPEQLDKDTSDVDTRSDIYSLGIILYELVAGTTPLDHQMPTSLTMAGMRQALNKKDIPRPSKHVRNLGRKTTVIAGRRGVRPPMLIRSLKGDLDWIVMKAIEVEPEHRYEDCLAFSDDLTRFLGNRAVSAGRPGLIRRTRKFFRRHKTSRYVISSVSLTVLIGICVMTYSFFHLKKDSPSLIEQRGWKLEKFCDICGIGANGFVIRPDGSVLIIGEWGSMPKGLYWIKKGGTASTADPFSIGEAFSDPEDALELSDGIYVTVNCATGGGAHAPGRLLKVPTEGGKPEVLCDHRTIINPYSIVMVPETFDGPNVDPGDFLIFDNAHGNAQKTTIWSVNRSTGAIRPFIRGNVSNKGFLGGGFAPNGMLYAGLNTWKRDEVSVLRISADGRAKVVFNNFYRVSESDTVPEHPIAVHPVTGEMYFGANNSIYAFLPEQTSPTLVVTKAARGMRWAPDGSKLYFIADNAVWTLSGPGIESQLVSLENRNTASPKPPE